MRIGCDPLHRHLLAPGASVQTRWQPIERWCEQLQQGQLDAALICVAGMATALESAPPAQVTPDIEAIPLGRQLLVLSRADHHRRARCSSQGSGVKPSWQLLLPPPLVQPLLWRQLEQLALLPLQAGQSDNAERWLQDLLQAPLLLPVQWSLLETPPWRDAGLKALPPPEPLEETLWLLVRQGEDTFPAIEALIERLQDRPLEGSRGMQPMN